MWDVEVMKTNGARPGRSGPLSRMPAGPPVQRHGKGSGDASALARPPVRYVEPVEFPEDFPERLQRVKEATGLSWNEFASALGMDARQVARWRKGVEPCGSSMLALFRLAVHVPGGLVVLLALDSPLIGASGGRSSMLPRYLPGPS